MCIFSLVFMGHGIVSIFARQDVYSNVTTVASVLSIIVVVVVIIITAAIAPVVAVFIVVTAISVVDALCPRPTSPWSQPF